MAEELAPVRDVQGLRLMPDGSIEEAGAFDVLVVPGGYAQQALMRDEEVLTLSQVWLFTFATLICALAMAAQSVNLQLKICFI